MEQHGDLKGLRNTTIQEETLTQKLRDSISGEIVVEEQSAAEKERGLDEVITKVIKEAIDLWDERG